MARRWSVAEAKAQLSRVVAETRNDVQVIERRGVEVAVVLDAEVYRKLVRLADQAMPEERMRRFVELSHRIATEGGVQLETPKRNPRPSPFRRRSR